MRKVSVVCRANQVRSRIIHGFIQSRYPGLETQSFGTSIESRNTHNPTLKKMMSGWGMVLDESPARSWKEYEDFLSSSDQIVAADNSIRDFLSKVGLESDSLSDFAVDTNHVPKDPIGYSKDEFVINSAKVLHAASRLLSFKMKAGLPNFNITAITQRPPLSRFELPPREYVIDARIRHLGNGITFSDSPTFFNQQMIQDGSFDKIVSAENYLYVPRYEFSNPEEILLSKNWEQFIISVARLGPIRVITAPQSEKIWDSYLTTILAQNVEYR